VGPSHPLPDGSKRTAWAALAKLIDPNDGTWEPDPPNVDQAEEAMLAIAAGEVDKTWTAASLKYQNRFVETGLARARQTDAERAHDGSQPSDGRGACLPTKLMGARTSAASPEVLEPPAF
jgi:hypothetical protein